MTDITDHMGAEPRRARHAPHRGEYLAYFTIIFVATVPLACLTWLLTALRQLRLPNKNPIRAAWSQAAIITPIIFSA